MSEHQKPQPIVRCEHQRHRLRTATEHYRSQADVLEKWHKDNAARQQVIRKAQALSAKAGPQARALAELEKQLVTFQAFCKADHRMCESNIETVRKLDGRIERFLARFEPGRASTMLPAPVDLKEAEALSKECDTLLKNGIAALSDRRRATAAFFDKLMAGSTAKAITWGKLGKLV